MSYSAWGEGFLSMLNVVVTVEPWTGTTGNGKPAYDTLRYYRAYINRVGELFRDASGQQVVSGATLYVHPREVNSDGTPKTGATLLLAFPENSRVTWVDASVPGGVAHPPVLKVNGLTDETGTVMYQVHC